MEYEKIKNENSSKNVVIGFGITEKNINSLKKADGLVVGSAICKEITNSIKKDKILSQMLLVLLNYLKIK